MLIAIIGGLGAATFWAAADVFIKKSVDKIDNAVLLFIVRLAGVVCALPLLLLDDSKLDLNLWVVFVIVVFGIIQLALSFLLFYAFRHGKVSFVTPVISTYTLLSAIISFVVFGEKLSFVTISLVVLVYFGIILVGISESRQERERKKDNLKGLAAAIGVMIAYAVYFPAFDSFIDRDGWGLVIVLETIFVTLLLLPFVLRKRRVVRSVPKKLLVIGFVAGLLNGIGNASLSLGFEFSEYTTTTVALASSTSAFAVVFAYVFLKERMKRLQYAGIVLVILGIMLVSLLVEI